MAENTLPPVKIAFIIDNEVVDILHTDDRLAAIFLSNPVILDVSNKMPLTDFNITVGSTYDEETDTFALPASLVAEQEALQAEAEAAHQASLEAQE